METTIEQKRSKAHSVLKLALFLSATTLIGTILLVILSKAAGIEILEAIGADLLGGRSHSGSGIAIFVTVMLLFMLTMAVAQGIYAQSIGELAAAHLNEEEYYPLKRARNGAYVQLAALVLLMLTPFLGNALVSTDSLILVFAVLISPWIVAIVGTIMMRSGFKSLYFCENTTGIRLEGTEDLRHTATCQLRLLFMPLVFLLFGVLMTVLLFKSLHSTWDGSGFYALSLDQLFQSIRDFKGRSGSTISTLRTFYYIYAIALAIFMFFTFLWYFFMLVKPVTGWNRFMKGLTAEENETETGTGGNRIANSLERLRNWHYYVVAGILVALMFLPLFKGSKKSPHNDEYVYNWSRNKIERQRNEVKVNSSSNEIIGYDTDYAPNGNVLIMANRGGVMTDTGIEIDSNWGNISDQHDYDGDGNMDALVSWSIGAEYPGNMFIVYYDKILCKFKRTEDFEHDCRPVLLDGEWTILYNTTTEKKRYRFDRGQLITIEHETIDPGDADRRITIETVFGDNIESGATKEYAIDLNDDGIDEIFSLTASYYKWGPIMYCDGFTSDGTAYDLPGQGTLVVLKNMTQGWHDVMWENVDLDEHYLFRWTGDGYEEVSL